MIYRFMVRVDDFVQGILFYGDFHRDLCLVDCFLYIFARLVVGLSADELFVIKL